MASKTKSVVWKYFDICANDRHFSVCKLCNNLVSRGGKTSKTFTTSAMIHHLQTKHKEEYKLAQGQKESDKQKVKDANEIVSTSTSQINKQLSLMESFDKKKMWDINDHRAIKIHTRIGEMMALDIQPYSIVDDVGFRNLIQEICPNYEIPSRRYFSQKVVPGIYDKLLKSIKANLSAASFISLTTDIWTANNANVAFLSLTGNWLSDEFSQQRAVLRVMYFPETHTGQNISEYLHKGLATFDIPHKKVHVVLRDNGANMVAGVRESGLKSISCFIHTMQLCVNDSILSQRSVKDILASCRKLASHFHHSPSAAAKLEMIQEQLGSNKHKLKQDVATRWNSSYDMLERMLEQRVPLATYTADHTNESTLSSYQWDLVEKVIHILEPFKTITVTFSKRESIVSEVIPSILALKEFFTEALTCQAFSGIVTLVEELNASVEKRLCKFVQNKYLCISTFLDPRYKLTYQNAAEDTVKNWLIEQMQELKENKELESSDSDCEEAAAAQIGITEAAKKPAYPKFSQCFRRIAHLASPIEESLPHSTSVLSQAKKRFKRSNSYVEVMRKEIADYLNLPLVGENESPLLWWKNCGNSLENLRKLAQKFLSAPPSSVESERLFSTGGNIYESTRNRLSPDNGEMLMFIHYNLRALSQK